MNPVFNRFCLSQFITITTAFTPASRIYQGSVIIKNKIYFLGGLNITNVGTSDLFYLDISSPFNSDNLKWTSLTPIPVKSAFAPSCFGGSNNSTIFLFEHRRTDNVDSVTLVTFTFDIVNQKWNAPQTLGIAPPSRQNMVAVVDKNGSIYINDFPNGTTDYSLAEIGMDKISVYNTTSGTWSLKTAVGGVAIGTRVSHTAVLSEDNSTIIIYGGASNNFTKNPYPSLAALDTSAFFSANKGFDLATASNNDVYILDTSNYTWVKSFDLRTYPYPPSNSSTDSNKIPLIAGLSSGLLALIIIASIIGCFCYRKHHNYIPTPGTNIDDNYIATPGTNIEDRNYIPTPGTDNRERD
ncbi:17662_t:CDS:2 [Cetraspora pellucida]|uniref:17662_t:CDS:1 n=1 Tax=Cetraspora pellucida TaxID=1433469 RepID=A0ACA9KR58_9GLOM|nr:17662_t:CDS:2 [Cetraspora pellucida]